MSANKGASQEAIQYHYDVGNAFYAPWLGPTMVYSAALWPKDRQALCTLEEAQMAKLDWHLDAAGFSPAGLGAKGQGRLLDVGCGWGSLMDRALTTRRAADAVGLTLSDEQAAWIGAHHAGKAMRAAVSPWQEYRDPEPFDGIVSIGAFEHFARPDMDRAAKVAHYRDFFRFCAESLTPGGRLSLQTIVWMNVTSQDEVGNLPLHIFPESNLPHAGEIMTAAEGCFNVMRFHNRPGDYSRTLRAWIRNLGRERAMLGRMTAPETVKRYRDGFAGFVLGFDKGLIGLTRWQMAKR